MTIVEIISNENAYKVYYIENNEPKYDIIKVIDKPDDLFKLKITMMLHVVLLSASPEFLVYMCTGIIPTKTFINNNNKYIIHGNNVVDKNSNGVNILSLNNNNNMYNQLSVLNNVNIINKYENIKFYDLNIRLDIKYGNHSGILHTSKVNFNNYKISDNNVKLKTLKEKLLKYGYIKHSDIENKNYKILFRDYRSDKYNDFYEGYINVNIQNVL